MKLYNRPHGYNKGGVYETEIFPVIYRSSTEYANYGIVEGDRIRKLTPLECWRLMGFDDEDFRKAKEVNSNTQLYKQAGNSIVVNVLEEIFCQIFDQNGEIYV